MSVRTCSFHESVIRYLVRSIPGAVENQSSGKEGFTLDGRIPDIIVKDGFRVTEVIEVETYNKESLQKCSGLCRTLVLALTDGDWDRVLVAADRSNEAFSFSRLSVDLTEIRKLEQEIQRQRNRLRGKLKQTKRRIGRRLTEEREKRRLERAI